MNTPARDLTRIILSVIAVGAMIVFSFWIVKPFVLAAIWATTIVTATWPVMRAVQRLLWGKRWLAVTVMTAAMLLIFVIPVAFVLRTIVHHQHEVMEWAKSAASSISTPPPAVQNLPLIGESLAKEWSEFSKKDRADLESLLTQHAGQMMRWLVSELGALGLLTSHFLLTVVIAAVLYATGEQAAHGVRLFLRRLAGDRGDTVMQLVDRAIRGVILGVVVGGLVQSILTGIGLVLAGVKAAVLLTAISFVLCLAQIGSTPVLGLAVIWLYANGHAGAGTFLLVWTILIVGLDHVVRPYLMKLGAELPLPLIFTGVVGGMAAFGLVGIFVGPVTLAVTYTLLEAWVREGLAPRDSRSR